ncbi:HYR domain-containing protein [Polyangium mundeleinium]|uniref:HYR domain-containing protein n=1 Tax=Polyangium mundeleinium TaxID=2995306 RepID=A0ABT5EIL3_9BACT|nr:HYR domain-containing protein [Polyangium mundeleinium]MDC0741591.1 HYR domain-containing protein [Polyangium mundeleinium]
MVNDLNCGTNVLAHNDDASATDVPLGFPVLINGGTYTTVHVNNNGYVTFGAAPPAYFDYTNLRLDTTSRAVIAPFMADIDTRNVASDEVTYGHTTYGGRSAFCVNWGNTNGVGYYDMGVAALNRFQLLLVDRSDVGFGDFDIIMNYDHIGWDGQDPTPPSNLPVWIGASEGFWTGFPGSGVDPGELRDGEANALVGGSLNTPTLGRYIHRPRGGLPPQAAAVSGTLYSPAGTPLAGATVQFCDSSGTCFFATTDADGVYTVPIDVGATDGGPLTMTASAPAGSTWIPPSTPISVTPAVGQAYTGRDVLFLGGTGPSQAVLTPSRESGVPDSPAVFWQDPLTLMINGCTGGSICYDVLTGFGSTSGTAIESGCLTESFPGSGLFQGAVGPFYPNHGWVSIVFTSSAVDGTACSIPAPPLDVYIDPSGHVNNTNGNRIANALVTLYRSDDPWGPFQVVPDGSTIMSPANRQNPMYSNERGHFGWDTLAGYYIVRAEKPGCTAIDDPAIPYAETDVLPVPPPVTDLDLRLDCSAVPPPVITAPTSVTAEATNSSGAAIVYEASAVDAADGPVEVTCAPASGALFPLGTTMVTCEAMNSYGNVATLAFPVTVADTTTPTLSLPATIEAYATSASGAIVSYQATAGDSVDGAVVVSCVPSSGTTFPPGETTVSCQATDASGNITPGSFDVRVTFDWGGVLPPLSECGTNTFKRNHVVTVRFDLAGASAGISTLDAQLFVARVVGGVVEPESPAVSVNGAGNVFKPVGPWGTYQLKLATKHLTPGTYQLRIDLGDGVPHTVSMRITP